jgi:hypothetical protein
MDNFNLRKYLAENKLLTNYKRLNEITVDDFFSSIQQPSGNSGMDIGTKVAVIKYGPSVILDIDDDKKEYLIQSQQTGKEVWVPFGMVQQTKSLEELPMKVQSQIKDLNQENIRYKRLFLDNLLSNTEDFQYEKYKLPEVVNFYLGIGQELWNIAKQYPEAVLYDDDYEELFLNILNDLVTLSKLDGEDDEDLLQLINSYEKIGKIIGAGTI